MKAKQGGVNVFAQIDRLRDRFRADMKRLPPLVEKRLGKKRKVRVDGVWWCVRFMGRTYRAMTPAALLKVLPKRGVRPPVEKPAELPLGGPADV
jgi:hypothetical protein